MDVGGVVEDHVDDDADAALMGLVDQVAEVLHGAVARVDARVVGDVVAAVAHGGGIEGRNPQRIHAQPRQVVQTGGQPPEVADPVAVGVREGAQQRLVEHGCAEPLRIRRQARPRLDRQVGDARDEHPGLEGPPRDCGPARRGRQERRIRVEGGDGDGRREGGCRREGNGHDDLSRTSGEGMCGEGGGTVARGRDEGTTPPRLRAGPHKGSTRRTCATWPPKGSRRT